MANEKKRIIVVGGAGSLELVAKLCNKFRHKDVVDEHLWMKFIIQGS